MLVLNSCQQDARVLRSARALAQHGYDVRVYALATQQHPAGPVVVDGVDVHRLQISSVLTTGLQALRRQQTRSRTRRAHLRRRRAQQRRDRRRGTGRAFQRARKALTRALDPLAGGGAGQSTGGTRMALLGWAYPLVLLRRRIRGRRHLAPEPAPGAARGASARQLVAELVDTWHRVGAFAAQWLSGSTRLVESLAYRSLRATLLKLHRPSLMSRFWRASAAEVIAWSADVVHAHDLNTLPGGARAARVLGAALVYDSHELWRHRNRGGQARPLGRIADALTERHYIKQADAVVTVSPSIGQWLKSRYRLSTDPVILRNTPARIDTSRGPTPAEVPADEHRSFRRSPEERVIGYSGRVTTGRGLEDVISALPQLPETVVLAILGYGDPGYVSTLADRARTLEVTERVRWFEAVPPQAVSRTMAQADVGLVAIQPLCLSYRFALPNKLFEAIQAGLPVLASDLPDLRQLVDQHELGETFRSGDVSAMRTAVLSVLERSATLRHNVDRARQELCWEREQSRLIALYAGLTRRAGETGPTPRR